MRAFGAGAGSAAASAAHTFALFCLAILAVHGLVFVAITLAGYVAALIADRPRIWRGIEWVLFLCHGFTLWPQT